jgi:hypothetical protein
VEASDREILTEDTEDRLSVVRQAVKRCDLPSDEVVAWCSAMLDTDRVRFIAEKPLQSLLSRFQADYFY